MLINLNSYKSSMLSLTSLALPTYVLPLNLDFASVLGLGFQYAFQILEIDFLFGLISEQRKWLRMITLMLCAVVRDVDWLSTVDAADLRLTGMSRLLPVACTS